MHMKDTDIELPLQHLLVPVPWLLLAKQLVLPLDMDKLHLLLLLLLLRNT